MVDNPTITGRHGEGDSPWAEIVTVRKYQETDLNRKMGIPRLECQNDVRSYSRQVWAASPSAVTKWYLCMVLGYKYRFSPYSCDTMTGKQAKRLTFRHECTCGAAYAVRNDVAGWLRHIEGGMNHTA